MSNEVATTTQETKNAVAPVDNGKPALYNPAAFAQIWRAAQMFASSDLVQVAYKGKPENCFIAIEMSDRMGISPFAMLQSLVIIQGKPSMEAKLIIALVNDSGIFEDPLEYEIDGDDPHAKNYRVRCFAKMRKTGKLCLGPWITYQMAEGEGWLSKGGSKWKTMPSIMFMYRAASFFAKVYCPNITMGMQTREELEDSTLVDVTPKPAPPQLVALTTESVHTAAATDAPPPLAAVTETVDHETGEVIDPPAPERTTQAKTKKKPAKAEVLVDEAQSSAALSGNPVNPVDEDWPDPPGVVVDAEPADEQLQPVDDQPQPVKDLF